MANPYQALRRFMEIPVPKTEVLPKDRMWTYSEVMRLLLERAGVSEPYYGHTTVTDTPEFALSDGMTVMIHRGPDTKMIDSGSSYQEIRPDAILRVTGPAQPERAYTITYEPVISHDGQIYVHTGSPHNLYRLANHQDDEALHNAFADLDNDLQKFPLE